MLQCLFQPLLAGQTMSHDQDDERPYTEEQWEALFRESDLKAAKFGELLETLHDQPDHELIIAREMGWTWLVKALEEKAANEGASSRPILPARLVIPQLSRPAVKRKAASTTMPKGRPKRRCRCRRG